MIFDYLSDAGEPLSREYPIGKAPSELVVDGVRYWRDYRGIKTVIKDKPFLSMAAPLKGSRWDNPNNPAPRYTPDGMAAFNSGHEAREWGKRGANEDGEYVFDP